MTIVGAADAESKTEFMFNGLANQVGPQSGARGATNVWIYLSKTKLEVLQRMNLRRIDYE
jgi:hypothetical protein